MLSLFIGMIVLTAIWLSLLEERLLPFDGHRVSWLAIACYTAVLLSLWIAFWRLV